MRYHRSDGSSILEATGFRGKRHVWIGLQLAAAWLTLNCSTVCAAASLEYIEHIQLPTDIAPAQTVFPHLRATFTNLNSTPSVCYTTGQEVIELNSISSSPIRWSQEDLEPEACELLKGDTTQNSGIYISYKDGSKSYVTNRNTLRFTFTGQPSDLLTVNSRGIPVVGTFFGKITAYLGDPLAPTSQPNMFRIGQFDFTVGLGQNPKIQFDSEQTLWTVQATAGTGVDFRFHRLNGTPTELRSQWRQSNNLIRDVGATETIEITRYNYAAVPYENSATGLTQFVLVDIFAPETGSYAGETSPIILDNSVSNTQMGELLRRAQVRDYAVARSSNSNEPDQLFIMNRVSNSIANSTIPAGYYLSRWAINVTGGTSPTPPAPPSLIRPANGANVPGTTAMYQWSSVPGATIYQPQFATNAEFSGAILGVLQEGTLAYRTVANDGSRNYWRVRARNDAGWSPWSTTWSFINGPVSTTPPAPPSLVSPANGANVPGTEVEHKWNTVTGATKYQAQYARNSEFTNASLGNERTGTSVNRTGMPNDGTRYYWRARAGNDAGWSAWSTAWSYVNGTASCTNCQPVDVNRNGEISDAEFSPVLTKWLNGAADAPSDTVLSSALSLWLNGGCYTSTGTTWTTRPCQ